MTGIRTGQARGKVCNDTVDMEVWLTCVFCGHRNQEASGRVSGPEQALTVLFARVSSQG